MKYSVNTHLSFLCGAVDSNTKVRNILYGGGTEIIHLGSFKLNFKLQESLN
jgi:hypothetical protein